MLGEVVDESPVEVLVHVTEGVSLLREHEHVETLSCPDQSVYDADCIARMDIVVDVSMDKEKMTFQILRDLRVCADLLDEGCVALLADGLLDSVVGLAPPAVVDGVVVVSCA